MAGRTIEKFVDAFPPGRWVSEADMERLVKEPIEAEVTQVTLTSWELVEKARGKRRTVPEAIRTYERDGRGGWQQVGN